jgi:hypothetical protein
MPRHGTTAPAAGPSLDSSRPTRGRNSPPGGRSSPAPGCSRADRHRAAHTTPRAGRDTPASPRQAPRRRPGRPRSTCPPERPSMTRVASADSFRKPDTCRPVACERSLLSAISRVDTVAAVGLRADLCRVARDPGPHRSCPGPLGIAGRCGQGSYGFVRQRPETSSCLSGQRAAKWPPRATAARALRRLALCPPAPPRLTLRAASLASGPAAGDVGNGSDGAVGHPFWKRPSNSAMVSGWCSRRSRAAWASE